MKHNNDTIRAEYDVFSKIPLRFRIFFSLIIVLFCCIVLVIGNQTRSRPEPGEDMGFDSSSLAKSDSQVPVDGEQKRDSSASGDLPISTIFTRLSEILAVLNSLATLIVKVACIYLLIEAAKLLAHYRRAGRLRLCTKKKSKKRGSGVSESFSKDAPDIGKCPRNIRFGGVTQPFSPYVKQNADSLIKRSPNIPDFSEIGVTDVATQTPEDKQDVEEHRQEEPVWFDFQDEGKAMKIMTGDFKQGPIYFVKVIDGALKGTQMDVDCYQVYPKMNEITEAELNYSSIKACFDIDRRVDYGKKFRIRFNQPAILIEEGKGIYTIRKKGKLTVTDTIE